MSLHDSTVQHIPGNQTRIPGAGLGFFERGAKLDRDIGKVTSQILEDTKPFHKALVVRFM